jgi:hypothetical protein
LQIGHQQRRGHSLSRDIRKNQAEPVVAQVKEVEVVAPDSMRGQAPPGVIDGLERSGLSRKQLLLYCGCDFELRFPPPPRGCVLFDGR